MSDSFNGYHVWLGIPPNEQPPNHYRLLGIAPFETDLDVIDHAADRQMAHVRTFQSGRNGALSQQILNELAAARICLLHAERKAEYDGQLRSKLSAASVAMPVGQAVPVAVPRAMPVMPAAPVAKAAPIAKAAPASSTPLAKGKPAGKPAAAASAVDPSLDLAPLADDINGQGSATGGSANGQRKAHGLDDGDELEVDRAVPLAERIDDDYAPPASLVSAGETIKITRRGRMIKRDETIQRTIWWLLVGVAVLIGVLLAYGLFRRATSDVKWGELFSAPQPAPVAPHDPAHESGQLQAPPPPTPGQHTDAAAEDEGELQAPPPTPGSDTDS